MYIFPRRKRTKPSPFSGFSFQKKLVSQEIPYLLERDPRDIKEGFGFEFPFLCAKLGAHYIPEVKVIDPVTRKPVRLASRYGSNEVKLFESNSNLEFSSFVQSCATFESSRIKELCRYAFPFVIAYFEDYQKQNNLQKLVCEGLILDEKIISALGCVTNWYVTLQNLQLQKSNLTSTLLKKLAYYLRTSNITILILDGNPISEQNYHVLLQDLGLKHLSLQKCEIDDAGVRNIARELQFKDPPEVQTLVHLNLSGNKIGDEGLQLLAYSLRTNRTLQEIVLSRNTIGDQGAVALATVGMKFPLDAKEMNYRRLRSYKHSKKYVDTARVQFGSSKSQTRGLPCKKEGFCADEKRNYKDGLKVLKESTRQMDVDMHPYIWDTIPDGLDMWCIGNFALKKIDLSHNRIGVKGAQKFTETLEYQMDKRTQEPKQDIGIKKIFLQGNFNIEKYHAQERIQDILTVHMRDKHVPKSRSVTTSVFRDTIDSKMSKLSSIRPVAKDSSKVSSLHESLTALSTNDTPPKKEEKSLTRKSLKIISISTYPVQTSIEEHEMKMSKITHTASLSYKRPS